MLPSTSTATASSLGFLDIFVKFGFKEMMPPKPAASYTRLTINLTGRGTLITDHSLQKLLLPIWLSSRRCSGRRSTRCQKYQNLVDESPFYELFSCKSPSSLIATVCQEKGGVKNNNGERTHAKESFQIYICRFRVESTT